MKVKVTDSCEFFGVSRWYLSSVKKQKQCTHCRKATPFRAKVFNNKAIEKRAMCPKCFYRWVVSINENLGNKVEITR